MEEEDLLEVISKKITPPVYKSLVGYADYIINRYYLWRRVDKVLPEGLTSEDFVKETIIKILDGTRKWNKDNNPDIVSALRGHIKSVISSYFRKKEHQVTTKTLFDCNDDDEPAVDIEDESLSIEKITELKETVAAIKNLIGNDVALQDLLMCFEDGITKRKEIAELLEINPSEVTNRLKRLDRLLKDFKKEE